MSCVSIDDAVTMIQNIVYFYPPQTVAVNTKELSRDTPYTYRNSFKVLHTPYRLKSRGFGGEIGLIFFKQIYFQIICLIVFLIG